MVCFLLARACFAATPLGPRLAVSGGALNHCRYIEQLSFCAFCVACDSAHPFPFPGLVAQGLGGKPRMGSFPHGLLLSGDGFCSCCPGAESDCAGCDSVSAQAPRLTMAGGCNLLWESAVEISPDDPHVLLVCRHQSGWDSAHGRDGVLRL